jgi:hypothetical protein
MTTILHLLLLGFILFPLFLNAYCVFSDWRFNKTITAEREAMEKMRNEVRK